MNFPFRRKAQIAKGIKATEPIRAIRESINEIAPIQLKVCWRRVAGKNCSSCEKCYRTILNILSNHGDPNEFGFEVDANVLLGIKKYLETHRVGTAFWKPIQDAFLAKKEYWRTKSEISWILDVKFNSMKTILPRVQRMLLQWFKRR